ncbi:ZmpA/ZmpB/ZmpC family metallo-endopeptidase, partial [Clostridium perfringens]
QSFGDGDVNWNLSYDYTPDKLITTNLTQDRINSLQEINSYYKGMFEAIDLLDYVEAKAFLQLTPQEQAQVAVQIQYPN